jgi:hypothetical protein
VPDRWSEAVTEQAGHIEPDSNEAILASFGTFKLRTAWRVLARNRARALFDLVREAEGAPGFSTEQQGQTTLIREGIARAVEAASFRPQGVREKLKDWYSGAGIETAWAELHRASERLLLVQSAVAVQDRIRTIDADLRNNLKSDDTRLTPATKRLEAIAQGGAAGIDSTVRQELRDYEKLGNEAGDDAHTNVRSLRNLLIVICVCTTAVLVAIAVLHALASGFLGFGTAQTAGSKSPAAPNVWEVEVVGMLGGMIAAVFTIAKLGGFSGPYRLPVYQALIRVPAGSAVALAAVVLMQSKQIGALSPQSGLSVLAVALVFGYAPDVLLRFMDQKATSLLGQAQGKNDPNRPPLTQPLTPPPA